MELTLGLETPSDSQGLLTNLAMEYKSETFVKSGLKKRAL